MIQLRGNNVYPSAIEAVVRRFAEVAEFRLVVTQEGALSGLRIEVEPMPEADGAILIDRVGSAIRNDLLFRADVVSVPPGSLPRFELKAQRLVREA
jgi:phenylacetate-CoA ligase